MVFFSLYSTLIKEREHGALCGNRIPTIANKHIFFVKSQSAVLEIQSFHDFFFSLFLGTLIKESSVLVNTVATVWVWNDFSVGFWEDITLEKFVCTPDSWDVVSLELLSLYFISIVFSQKNMPFHGLKCTKIKNLQPESNYNAQFLIQ